MQNKPWMIQIFVQVATSKNKLLDISHKVVLNIWYISHKVVRAPAAETARMDIYHPVRKSTRNFCKMVEPF